jgi:ankyrin repeat protein
MQLNLVGWPDPRGDNQVSPLMIAAGEGHVATVTSLLSKRAAVEATDDSGALNTSAAATSAITAFIATTTTITSTTTTITIITTITTSITTITIIISANTNRPQRPPPRHGQL